MHFSLSAPTDSASSSQSRCYHLYIGAAWNELLFAGPAAFDHFLDAYRQQCHPLAHTYAYCLLPNHFHFLVQPYTLREQAARWFESAEPVDAFEPQPFFDRFHTLIANCWSETICQTLNLVPVYTPQQRTMLIRYIHQNPVKHNVCDNFRSWRWSSYQAIAHSVETCISADAVRQWFYSPEWFDEQHWISADETAIGSLILYD